MQQWPELGQAVDISIHTCVCIGEMAELMCDALPFAVNNGALIKKTWLYKIIESLWLEKTPQVI